jgi:uncharacterized phage protein (predicted DNA packaging)
MSQIPNVRVSFHDRDNFIRDLMTILTGSPAADGTTDNVVVPSPLSKSVRDASPILTLDQIKAHLRIDPSNTDEDDQLTLFEQAAHLHTANVLRLDVDDTVGENVKVANLLLIAHWYRNRETVGDIKLGEIPLAYMALLIPERSFTNSY